MSKTRINLLVPENLYRAATTRAERRGTSMTEVIRTAIREYVGQGLKKE